MGDFFNGLGVAIHKYFTDADFSGTEIWLFLLLPVAGIWIIGKIALLFQSKSQLKRRFTISKSVIFASFIFAGLLIGTYSYFWADGFYKYNNFQFANLLGLVICYSIAAISFYKLAEVFGKDRIKDIIGQPISKLEESRFNKIAKAEFQKLKRVLIIPFLGFLMLLILQTKTYNLVSFVLDTSSSMTSDSGATDAPLEVGKNALGKTITELDQYTDIILTTFQEGENKSSISEILNEQDLEKLNGFNTIFYGHEKNKALNYIKTIGQSNDITTSSPLCETIWKNFLFTKEQSAFKNYSAKVCILITDGDGNLGKDIEGFLCDNQEYMKTFSDNINIINLNDSSTPYFLEKAQGCGFNIEEGYDAFSYNTSLDRILKAYKSDWNMIYWMAIICLIFTVSILLINPKFAK